MTIKSKIASLAFAASMLLTGTAMAAQEWGIEHEKKARFEAKVVDILCELTGNCPDNCGAGKRQLGLLNDEGKLIAVFKNRDPFAGAVNDLIEYCGKRIVADGLMIEDPQMTMFVVQFTRLAPDRKWKGSNQFTKDWVAANPGKKGNQWFRSDADVKRLLAEGGDLGIPGLKAE